MKIFYFTGTGNSLAAAKRLDGELVSIPQVMKEGNFVFENEAIGIIFPLYCLNPPKMVREFLSRAEFHTEYLFAVATYGNLAGASMQEAASVSEKIASESVIITSQSDISHRSSIR